MSAAHPDRFPDDVSGGFKARWNSGTILTNARGNYEMRVVNAGDLSANMRLNVSVRWVDPLDWTEDDVDGAFCAACYKINNGSRDDHRAVVEVSENSDLDVRVTDDQFNTALGILYSRRRRY